MTDRTATTRSLDRAVDILEVLAMRGPSSLEGVHRLTGLPKSTVKRLLGALVRRNLVRRGLSDGHYRINVTMPLPGDATHVSRISRLVKASASHLVDLTCSIGWPADLHIFHQDRMQIIETTHALSPFEVGKRDIYDLELNVFAAASGIAYLSTISNDEIWALIGQLELNDRFSLNAYRISPSRLFKEVDRARKTNFGRRLVNQTGAGKFDAIAVPIRSEFPLGGVVSVWWPRAYRSTSAFWEMHGDEIIQAARLISKGLAPDD